MGNGDVPTEGAGAPKKAVNITGIQFDPDGESLLVFTVKASIMPNKTAEEIEKSDGAPAPGNPPAGAGGAAGAFGGGGTGTGDPVVFGGGGMAGDSVVFGGGGEFTISIPVSLTKA